MSRRPDGTRNTGGLRLSDEEVRAAFSDTEWARKFPPVLTVTQAAELAQVPVATIYDWKSRGRLAGCARRVGRHVRVHRDRFLAFIFGGDA